MGDLPGFLGRRQLLQAAAAAPLVLASPSRADPAWQADAFWSQPRTVWMRRPATGEEIRETYWADGHLIDDAYRRLCWFMRDVRMERRINQTLRTGYQPPASWHCAAAVSLVLLDILYATNGWLRFFNLERPLILLSGFRHQLTNAETEGAALNSRHVRAGAADIAVPGVSTTAVARYGQWLAAGGIGWYPSSGFTHVDDGRLRVWRG